MYDQTHSPTVASAMTQPARRTFLPGHVVVIICSITIQLSDITRTIHLEQHERSYSKIATFAILGLLFLSYPLLGYIADVCLTRYRTLKCSFILLIIGCTIGMLLLLVSFFIRIIEKRSLFNDDKSYHIIPLFICGIPLIALITTGVGLFEANALQFGLDQLLEAPTPKLIAFIHWYYWTHNVVQLVAMYTAVGWKTIEVSLNSQNEARFIQTSLFFTVVAILGLAACCRQFSTPSKIKASFIHSESRSQPIQEYLQSAQVFLEPQGP